MKKALNIIGNVILWIFVAFAAFMTIIALSASKSSSGLPNVFGKALITIESPSMSGTFEEGDLIISDIADNSEEQQSYVKDDIITFKFEKDDGNGNMSSALNSHRIIEKYEENGIVYYKTQGDNNPGEDTTPVASSDVLAKYTDVKLSGMGNVINFLRSKTGFLICIVLPLILFFLFELSRFIIILVRSKGTKSDVDEDEIKRKAIEDYKAQLAAEKEAEKAAKHAEAKHEEPKDDVTDEPKGEAVSEEKTDSDESKEV